MVTSANSSFLERARHEAGRYGTDPWVFVRELLQNARDAGAHRVWLTTSRTNGRDRITCRDDGSGMGFEHAQRYLFSLYASSKRRRSRAAGRFGIGFWSVLRFEPDEIVIRSRAHRGEPWQVRFDGRLEEVRRETTIMELGTEVVLERPASAEHLERPIVSAVLRDAPFLRCRHRAEHPLEVQVNGRLVRAEPVLPPPSLSFRRRGLRGVVGLGREPLAEIFAHGLRVRDAPTLDELLVETRPDRSILAGAFEGLAPRVIIDSRDLEVMMARGDAREDRALKRLVATGHRELSRLVRTELDRHLGLSPIERSIERLREIGSTLRVPKTIAVVVLAAALGFLGWHGMTSWFPDRALGLGPKSAETTASVETPPLSPYQDRWGGYRGPDVDSVGRVGAAVDLSYRPSAGERYFAALWVTGIRSDGQPEPDLQRLIGPYIGALCADDCLGVELGVDSPAGVLRLPITTGHLIDPESVYLDGLRLAVVAVATGQPAVRFDRHRSGRLRYRSGRGVADGAEETGAWPTLPPEVAEFARGIAALPTSTRAAAAAEFIGRHVVYDTSAETVAEHRRAQQRSVGLFARAMAVGAGDCDVQNSLVAAMLDSSGVPSRLAVGWVGVDGRAQAGLHAWAEYRGVDGRWRAVDASVIGDGSGSDIAAIPRAGVAAADPRNWKLIWVSVAMVAALGVALLAIVFGGGIWRRSLLAGDADAIVDLLRGAAVRPRAFEEIHSLSSRRLLRLLGGRSISLSKARQWAKKGFLACGSRRSELSRRAANGGGKVLDLDQPEGAAVAEVLAAVNLDRWQKVLDRVAGNELTELVEVRLAAAGEPCRVVIAENAGLQLTVLDGVGYGLGSGEVWVVLDEGGLLWQSILRIGRRRPAEAALVLMDAVVRRIGAPPAVRQRCLSTLATDVLFEAAGQGS